MRVDSLIEEHKVFCPQCGKILSVPSVSKKAELTSWQLRSIDDDLYGPYSEAEIDQLISEFRIISTSELKHPKVTGGDWMPAKDISRFYKLILNQTSQASGQEASVEPPEPIVATLCQEARPAPKSKSFSDDLKEFWKGVPVRPKIVAYILAGSFVANSIFFMFLNVLALIASVGIESDEGASWYHLFTSGLISFVIVSSLAMYATPTIIAYVREHKNIVPIMIVNICFGWTLLGWLLALIWSCTAKEKATYVHTHIYAQQPYHTSP